MNACGPSIVTAPRDGELTLRAEDRVGGGVNDYADEIVAVLEVVVELAAART